MPSKQPRGVKLTPDLEAKITAAIRAGGFPHVAAEAFGVPREKFQAWIKRYKSFAVKITQARAQARLKAEMAVHDRDPRLWLRSGPGKEGPDNPGWTAIVRPQITEHRTLNLYTSPDFLNFMATLRSTLAPFPEALKALTDAMDGKPKAITALESVPKPVCEVGEN